MLGSQKGKREHHRGRIKGPCCFKSPGSHFSWRGSGLQACWRPPRSDLCSEKLQSLLRAQTLDICSREQFRTNGSYHCSGCYRGSGSSRWTAMKSWIWRRLTTISLPSLLVETESLQSTQSSRTVHQSCQLPRWHQVWVLPALPSASCHPWQGLLGANVFNVDEVQLQKTPGFFFFLRTVPGVMFNSSPRPMFWGFCYNFF